MRLCGATPVGITTSRSSAKFVQRPAHERDVAVVRRVEGAAEEAGHSHFEHLLPDLDLRPLRTPAARSAASSLSGSDGGVPATR